jgi:hypothetical protein
VIQAALRVGVGLLQPRDYFPSPSLLVLFAFQILHLSWSAATCRRLACDQKDDRVL